MTLVYPAANSIRKDGIESKSSGKRAVEEISKNDITLLQKMLSACLGAFITSLVLTPFDVVRIRIQQQEMLPESCCQSFPQAGEKIRITSRQRPPVFWIAEDYCRNTNNCTRITSISQGLRSISRSEGALTLWRGLSFMLMMSIPSNIIYFTGYEYIRDSFAQMSPSLSPFVSGISARFIAASSVAPLELLKTRLQSVPSDLKSKGRIVPHLVKDLYHSSRTRGLSSLFTGLELTLWRDVPFSGIYWFNYEYFKHLIGNYLSTDFKSLAKKGSDDWKVFITSFISGTASGSIASIMTHPFDVGKTRLQISEPEGGKKSRPVFLFLLDIYKGEGMRSLYSGFVPRILKVAPSCAIMISSYEISKKFFKVGNNA